MRRQQATYYLFYVVFWTLISCSEERNTLFQRRPSSETGITFSNRLTDTPELNILTYLYYYNGAGVAAADFNGDGLIDLYFTGNQVADKLYLNEGDLQFRDVTNEAQIDNADGWTTGATHVDINGDGLLDIYVCKVGNHRGIEGKNLLYVNQGNNKDNIPQFKEMGAMYGLDIKSFATQASFFDYDLDGDLDCFLLNHSVHPNRTYGNGRLRQQIDNLSGDRLLRNDEGSYIDVSQEAGIFQGKIGYGLGLAVGDLNNDGCPDLYVGNDFFENDYLYLNMGDGTFEEVISTDTERVGHTTHFSMGNDIADINNDGWQDILSLDMLPEDIETYKASSTEFGYQIYQQYLKNGYAPQFMQNTLHLNHQGRYFSEVGYLSGMAASEWSWSMLAADYDNDGDKDLHIANGIKGATNDMDFISFIANENIQKRINQGMSAEDMALISELPEKKVSNYFFENKGDLQFQNATGAWSAKIPSFSNGAAYADLDNDGDLDMVINNVNEKAWILENKAQQRENVNNYLKIKFKGTQNNPYGIGAKVIVHVDSAQMAQENFVSRGYLSAIPPELLFGLGDKTTVDSLTVIWPGGAFKTVKGIEANQTLVLEHGKAVGNFYTKATAIEGALLVNVPGPIPFQHKEEPCYEFNRDPLIPYARTNEGPCIEAGDIDGDGLDDVFVGGAKRQPASLFIQQKDGSFLSVQEELFKRDALAENTDALFFDMDNDNDLDLLVVSGGNEFKTGDPLRPLLYKNEGGSMEKVETAFSNIALNASVVRSLDFDGDGDRDLVMGASSLPWQFGRTATNYLFENDGTGVFLEVTEKVAPAFKEVGLIEDIAISDVDGDGTGDMVVVGHWMPVSIFVNRGGTFQLRSKNELQNTSGWWNTLVVEDFDEDGDMDIMAGNWGLNTRLKASLREPIQLYSNDFDDNGAIEPIVTYFYQGKETVFSSKEELAKQLPSINKKFLSFNAFAKAEFREILPKDKIADAYHKQVYELGSCYFENKGEGTFLSRPLPGPTQISSVTTMWVEDFDKDGHKDVLLAGNNYEVSTQLGRSDASHGSILINDKRGFFKVAKDQRFDISGPARDIQKTHVGSDSYYLIMINNDSITALTSSQK